MEPDRIDAFQRRAPLETAARHVPAALASGAVILYALGIISTVGALRATNVDVSQAFGRIPLEVHLRNGIAVLVEPFALVLIVAFGLMYFVIRIAAREADREVKASEQAPPVESRKESDLGGDSTTLPDEPAADDKGGLKRRLGVITKRGYFLAVLLSFGVGAISAPWPDGILIATAGSVFLLPSLLNRVMKEQPQRTRAEMYLVVVFGLTALVAALDAYFRSDPLPNGRVVTSKHTLRGPVIASDSGVLYLAPPDRKRLYVAIPIAKIASFTATPQRRRREPSALNYLGIDWR